jgi:hypothetical protein
LGERRSSTCCVCHSTTRACAILSLVRDEGVEPSRAAFKAQAPHRRGPECTAPDSNGETPWFEQGRFTELPSAVRLSAEGGGPDPQRSRAALFSKEARPLADSPSVAEDGGVEPLTFRSPSFRDWRGATATSPSKLSSSSTSQAGLHSGRPAQARTRARTFGSRLSLSTHQSGGALGITHPRSPARSHPGTEPTRRARGRRGRAAVGGVGASSARTA